jgi:hypothetical protein
MVDGCVDERLMALAVAGSCLMAPLMADVRYG